MNTLRSVFMVSLLCLSLAALAAEKETYSFKYGKVTDAELSMTVYQPDTTAEALVIYDQCEMNYTYSANKGFEIVSEVSQKQKILKEQGKDRASIEIHCNENYDRITSISGVTYNLKDGKVQKTKLSKDYIVEEQVDKNKKLIKISMPGVNVGSVFEIKFKRYSQIIAPDDWVFQHSVPVIYSHLEFAYPEYFIFNMEQRGAQNIEIRQSDGNVNFLVGEGQNMGNVTARTTQCEYTARNLPALKRDIPFLWSPGDYATQMVFELQATSYPWDIYRPYNQKWEDIDVLLMRNDDFGARMNLKNPFQEQMASIDFSAMNTNQKVQRCHKLLRESVRWNGDYRLFSASPKSAIKNGTGTNADLNFILMAMMRSLDIPAVPVVMRERKRGMLPVAIPSASNLTTFVICYPDDNEGVTYIDASMEECLPNLLSPSLLVSKAHIVDLGEYFPSSPSKQTFYNIYTRLSSRWVDLRSVGRNTTAHTFNTTLSPEGKIVGTRTTEYTGIDLDDALQALKNAKDTVEYEENIEKKYNLSVRAFSRKMAEEKIIDELSFEKECDVVSDSAVYVNPLMIPHITDNPFSETERALPVELNHTEVYLIASTFVVPEGYTVSSLPKSQKMRSPDGGCSCNLIVVQNGNTIQAQYLFRLNNIFYDVTQYAMIREFYSMIVDKNKTMIELKKN